MIGDVPIEAQRCRSLRRTRPAPHHTTDRSGWSPGHLHGRRDSAWERGDSSAGPTRPTLNLLPLSTSPPSTWRGQLLPTDSSARSKELTTLPPSDKDLAGISAGTSFAGARNQLPRGYDPDMDGHDAMQPAPRDTRLMYEDFLLFPDDGRRHELIDGEHYVTPSPNTRHQELVGRLHFELALYLRGHREAGRVFLAPFDVIFTRWDVVEPDLLFVAGDQASIITDKNVQGPPALMVEVLSPGTRRTDEQVKRRLFDRGGVREELAGRSRTRIDQSLQTPNKRRFRSGC